MCTNRSHDVYTTSGTIWTSYSRYIQSVLIQKTSSKSESLLKVTFKIKPTVPDDGSDDSVKFHYGSVMQVLQLAQQ
jgi:hypothetical protein